ncbi:MAG: hypothetical protein JOZ62_19670 [Acidobacteriaceae bacterium]|nr:hypothetical protein [Acidobacteriaceae bacterium]
MFKQLFDLNTGFRVFDFNLTGKANDGSNPFADNFQLTASGLGGDPFPGGQLTVSKTNVYDLRVNYRQSYYYWDQNDNAILPNGLHGLTANHNWATVRRFGGLNFLVHATNNLRFRFEYDRNGRDGTIFTTRVLDYFGAPASWGTFERDNPYYVLGPEHDMSNRYAGGIDYTWRDWTIHYTLGYQTFDQAFNWTNPAVERSINIDSTANIRELLANGDWTEFRRLNAPSSEVFFNGKVTPRLTWRGDFLYFRYRGPSTIEASYNGTARVNTTGTIVAPYAISLGSRARDAEPNYVLDQGFTYKLKEWWNFDADYRFNRFSESGTGDFLGRDAAGTYTGTTTQQWRQSLNQLDLRMEFTRLTGLVVSPGIRLMKRDVFATIDGQVDPIRTLRTKTAWPIGSFFYRPWKGFSVRGDFQSITNNTSYTRITPHTDIGTRWVFRYQLTPKFSVEDSLSIRNQKLVTTTFRSTTRANSSIVSYALNGRFSAFAGFSYDSFFASDSVTFLRGTPPLNTSWRDQTVNRLWQLGINAQPTQRLGFEFNGNFVRSTGLGEITLEQPRFGPLTFPLATATVRYDFPRFGRFAVDLQRAYYHEQIVRGNDFNSSLLTLRWTAVF